MPVLDTATAHDPAHEPAAGQEAGPERQALDLLGYTAPLPLAEPRRAHRIAQAEAHDGLYRKNPHVADADVRHLLADPALAEAVARYCGTDYVLWRSAFFQKTEGSKEIGWHHDKHFQAGEAEIRLDTGDDAGAHFSILFGLTGIGRMNGLLEVIPGSHRPLPGLTRDLRPFHRRPASDHILTGLPADLTARARPVPIPAGCFLIFHSALLHRSLPHQGGGRRLGMAIRLAPRGLGIPEPLAAPEEVIAFPPAA